MLPVLVLALAFHAPADTSFLIGGTEVPMVRVEAGSFHRDAQVGRQHVTLTSGFHLGATEVTWATWDGVMGWTDGRDQPDYPARRMSWTDVTEFLRRASEATPGWTFRLPTEAEWEYAARAGSTTPWASGEDASTLTRIAWVRENSGGAVQPVAGREPNAWGLYDMHGNVWEWVADWMGPYPDAPRLEDPIGPSTGTERVRRGGSAVYGSDAARSSHRYQQPPNRGNGNLGFRIVAVRVVDEP